MRETGAAGGRLRRVDRGTAAANGAASVLGGVISAGTIAVVARRGEIGDIAAFTVMTALMGLAAGVSAGGSSLRYLTGDAAARRATRLHRLVVVVPVLLLVAVSGTFFYAALGFTPLALAAVGATAFVSNLGELHFSALQKQLRFKRMILTGLAGKVCAISAVLIGFRLPLALLMASVVQLVLLERGLGSASWLRKGLAEVCARPARPRLRPPLMAYSYIELYTSRIAVLVLALVVDPVTIGHYGIVLSAYAALSGAAYAAMQVPLARRVQRRDGRHPSGSASLSIEPALLLLTCAAAGVFAFSAPALASVLGLPPASTQVWMTLLAMTLPAYLANRMFATYSIADGREGDALLAVSAIAAVHTLVLPTALFLSITAAPLAAAVGEVTVVLALAPMLLRRRSRGSATTDSPGASEV